MSSQFLSYAYPLQIALWKSHKEDSRVLYNDFDVFLAFHETIQDYTVGRVHGGGDIDQVGRL